MYLRFMLSNCSDSPGNIPPSQYIHLTANYINTVVMDVMSIRIFFTFHACRQTIQRTIFCKKTDENTLMGRFLDKFMGRYLEFASKFDTIYPP